MTIIPGSPGWQLPLTPALLDIAIDIGDAQTDIDWGALAESDILIVMVKATEGQTFTSPTFGAQLAGAQKAGKLVVPYHYMRPGSDTAQAKYFLSVTGIGAGQPFAIDWEGRASQTATPIVCEGTGGEISVATNRLPLGYWGIPGSTPAQPTKQMLTWDRWEPRYPRTGDTSWANLPAAISKGWPRIWPGAPLFIQYTMWGRVPGISGGVDRSVMNVASVDAARAWYSPELLLKP